MDIRLRPTALADIPYVYETEQMEENRAYILPWESTRHEQSLANPDIRHLIVEDAKKGNSVGYVILAGLANPHASIEFMRITISEKRKGYGRKVLQEIKRLAFDEWGANRLWLDVKEENRRALQLYLSEGFIMEGKLRECLKTNDRYESLIVLSMLAREYKSWTQT
ncbi:MULTISPECIES: GNAT family N-acetyltransferase [Brevibacillus]|jgi:RimJ/RimL family protein N-acetyltransferase|uniref:GNAT family N-acetyltransferase n=1 Tax=Brevibacillus TaxID=55080 RepID=UPI00046A85BE|nr:GNAT family protein [Brevibacillus borstelensis]KKX54112.1 acetyltransferase [Brevibacillus borstelensis cifa_chp40]MCC0564273.1 GNAT family N-acetyltransferase [Brevibacillus borstelensis]MCM3473374.1 GNAT family N-acetyltransferase [Brevibacillus borstelensis]MCM3559488.1 GNAT family N-acetyltransferase [Brevibacillus borstelensis]MCM3589017.1 GNAT family N-acetyltransferase [Brevibacillus borstelensis]